MNGFIMGIWFSKSPLDSVYGDILIKLDTSNIPVSNFHKVLFPQAPGIEEFTYQGIIPKESVEIISQKNKTKTDLQLFRELEENLRKL